MLPFCIQVVYIYMYILYKFYKIPSIFVSPISSNHLFFRREEEKRVLIVSRKLKQSRDKDENVSLRNNFVIQMDGDLSPILYNMLLTQFYITIYRNTSIYFLSIYDSL